MSSSISFRDKIDAIRTITGFRPFLSLAIVLLSAVAALLEGVGLSFLVPIIQLAEGGSATQPDGITAVFFRAYRILGIPFSLESVLLGVAAVIAVRYTASFLVAYLRTVLGLTFVRSLQRDIFDDALSARVAYFDTHGSDEILNAIITQAEYGSDAINRLVRFVEQSLIALIYLSIAVYLAPVLTIGSGIILGVLVFVVRRRVGSGYAAGSDVADANEQVQHAVQAGVQGIRDVKLFDLESELFDSFETAVDRYVSASVRIRRNAEAMDNFYQMITAFTVFALIYTAVTVASLSLARLGVFLFAVFRLAPRVNTLNNLLYELDSRLPHLVRTQRFQRRLDAQQEVDTDGIHPPIPTSEIAFEDVSFAYDDERVLDEVSFTAKRDEFVAFVGPSGAGKSTVVSLVARLYEPDTGRITADGTPITEFDIDAWRDRIAVVRQQPHVFNDTLRYNVTIGNRDASQAEVDEACEIAQVSEFLDDLPSGYETELGDDGVRLSGGQRQRIAIARALLTDADFLVFDEATSDLDTALEARVHSALEAMDRECGLLVVAHRLSTVSSADTIHAMRDGRIVESGTHTELLDQDGLYTMLHES
ncbi:ABC transporter ATP-binding protein/permease [Halomicroarcula sp. S1AR25-4]|uniref:ABC transporter ATP-binding protein n=1 Tax=Haloarcula sp. S1AR25-4 TaxID=2950538 RepID=UPI002876AFBB|nr:ABC transporter ATP-binding protein [Halomicroarcula sp. S1AR25-4]MDS0278477.1 ABC transporter ATP-binding protein/permease [Halomicroarcula sp. S1AR25-4]